MEIKKPDSVAVGQSSTQFGGANAGSKAKYATARKYPDLPVEKNQKGAKAK